MVMTKVVLRELSDPIGLSSARNISYGSYTDFSVYEGDIGDAAQLFWFTGIALHSHCV